MPVKKKPSKSSKSRSAKSAQSAHPKKARAGSKTAKPVEDLRSQSERGVAMIGPFPKRVSIEEQKNEFIEELQNNGGIVSAALRASGLARRTAYDHLAKDPEFKEQWFEAVEISHDEVTEVLRDRALGRGMSQMPDTLLIYLHKNGENQQKWRSRLKDAAKKMLDAMHLAAAAKGIAAETRLEIQEAMLKAVESVPLT
jgi:hypothetical protein